MMLMITLAALLVLVSDWRHALAWAVLATAAMLVVEVFALRSGLYVSASAVVCTVWATAAFRCVSAWRARRPVHHPASNNPHAH
jgi:hypothetical protein